MKPIYRAVISGLSLITATTPVAFSQAPADPAQTEIAELRQQVQDLAKLVKDLQAQVEARPAPAAVEPVAPSTSPPPPVDSKDASVAATPPHEPDLATDIAANPLPEPKRSDANSFNPEISAAIDSIASYSAAGNNLNFTMRDVEIMFQANVDQLAHAYVVFNAESELDPWTKTDPFSEVSLGVEEAAIETTALPYGLQIKAGQYFADFTRLGKVHSHELPFTDRPASLEGIIGGEAKVRGAELSWLPPIDHYIRLTVGVGDTIGAETDATGSLETLDGEDALFLGSDNRAFGDLTYYGRAATIFELGDRTTLNLGVNYAHGSDQGTRQLATADFKLTWLPDPASFDRLEIGGEFLHGETDGDFTPDAVFAGGPTNGSSRANGAYIYAQYRIGKDWEPGIRYDWFRPESWSQTDADSDGIADGLARTWVPQNSWMAYVNYNLSEFSRLRLGTSYLSGTDSAFDGKDNDWLTYLQWTVVIGAHKHSFQP